MSRLVLIVAVIFLAWWILRKYLRSIRREKPPAAVPEDMVRCAHCGVHLPRSEGLADNGRIYCSDDHMHRDR